MKKIIKNHKKIYYSILTVSILSAVLFFSFSILDVRASSDYQTSAANAVAGVGEGLIDSITKKVDTATANISDSISNY
ncbi:MAG: hypothetical protein HQ537_01920 [Parcubacteria group bacterium]|nr:hypothetical protein [Parcubacteria group bacterium]